MARFYKTSETRQEDYTVDPRLYKALASSGAVGPRTSKKADSEKVGSTDVGVIPDDIPAYREVKQEYEQEITGLVSELRRSPNAYKQLEPRIADLRQRITMDSSPGGRLYAFDQRAKTYNKILKDAQEQYKDNRDAYEFAISRIDTGGGAIDPETGAPIPVKADFTKLWGQKQEQDFLKTASQTITPQLMREAQAQGIDLTDMRYKNAMAVMTTLGYTPERATEHIANLITPDMLRQMQYSFDYGQARGRIPQDADFETYLEKKKEEWANSLAGTKSLQQTVIQEDTDAAWAMKRRVAASGRPAEEISIGNFSPFVGAMAQTLESQEFKTAMEKSTGDYVTVPNLASELNNGLGTLFGKDNVITEIAFNKKDNQFYYKSLIDIASDKGTEYDPADQRKWRPLTTQTILNMSAMKTGTKFKAEALINHLKQLGVLNKRQQFDWSGFRGGGSQPRSTSNTWDDDTSDLRK
jgi:hypothetical protein